MFSWKEFDRAKNILSETGRGQYHEALGQHHVAVRPKNLLRWMEFVSEDLGFLVLLDMTCIDSGPTAERRFELVYHLLNMGSHQRLNLRVSLSDGEVVPSVRKFFSHADWLEREQAEMFQIRFDSSPAGLLLPEGQKNFPLRKNAVIRGWPLSGEKLLPKNRTNPNKSETPYPEESWVWKRYPITAKETQGNFE